MADETKVFAPNMRFGASFISTKNHKRAVNDEVLLDKTTGEVLWKRNTDGHLICFTQENMQVNNYVQQMKALVNRWKNVMIRPSYDNSDLLSETYLIASNISMIDFAFDSSDAEQSVLKGSRLLNPYPSQFSIALEQNGFFVDLSCAPRDRALISYMTSIYDDTYRKYDGTDETALERHAMYAIDGYDHSQAMIQYTVSYYDTNGEVYNTLDSSGFIRLNEISWVPFDKATIYNRDTISMVKVRINSIECPKLPIVIDELLSDATKQSMYRQFKENADVSFQTLQISAYVTPQDSGFTLPTIENTHSILFMSWDEFEAELIRNTTTDIEPGIRIAISEPSSLEWEELGGWFEINRTVLNDGTTESTGSETNIEELEKNFGAVAYHNGKFTENVEDVEDYYIKEPLE